MSQTIELSQYSLLEPLSEGSTATLYLALHRPYPYFNRPCVVKRYKPFAKPDVVEGCFQSEALIASRLLHPNLMAAQTCFREGRENYLVFPYAQGVDLQELLSFCDAAGLELGHSMGMLILDGITRGLEYLHNLQLLAPPITGFAHGDLATANIFLTVFGTVSIIDFAAAQPLSRQGEGPYFENSPLRGTPPFAAPELSDGAPPTVASDLYSLGVVAAKILRKSHDVLGDLIGRCQSPLIQDRPQSVREFRQTMEAAIGPGFEQVAQPKELGRFITAVAAKRLRKMSQILRTA